MTSYKLNGRRHVLRGNVVACPLTLQIRISFLEIVHMASFLFFLFFGCIRRYIHATAAISGTSGTPPAALALMKPANLTTQNEKDCCRKNHYDYNIC